MQKRWNEIFAELFDPKVPILFLIGSLSLTVAGSALYTIITTFIGLTIQNQSILLVVALLAGLFAVTLLRQLIERWATAFRKPQKLVIPPERQPTASPLLILSVGTNTDGPEMAALDWHTNREKLRQCWMLATPQSQARAERLSREIQLRNASVEIKTIADPFSFTECYSVAREAIAEAQQIAGGRQIIVDITGATAIVSVGLTLAAREAGIAIEYVVRQRNTDGTFDPKSKGMPMLIAEVEAV